jgi:xylulokinase
MAAVARETDPAVWEGALASALAATGRAEDLAAVSIAAQQHGLVLLDASGAVLRGCAVINPHHSRDPLSPVFSARSSHIRRWRSIDVVPGAF